MTEQQLADLDALAAAATPGPWEQIDSRAYSSGTGLQVCLCNETDADAAFIAAARTAVPALVAEVRRLRHELARAMTHAPRLDERGIAMDRLMPRGL